MENFLPIVWGWLTASFTPPVVLGILSVPGYFIYKYFLEKKNAEKKVGDTEFIVLSLKEIKENISDMRGDIKNVRETQSTSQVAINTILERQNNQDETYEAHKKICGKRFDEFDRAIKQLTSTPPTETKKNGSSKGRVLVVDDEATITGMLRDHLEIYGYSVVTANRYDDAVQAINNDRYKWALIDVILKDGPEKDGYHLWELLHRKFRDTRLVLFSGQQPGALPQYIQKNIQDLLFIEKVNLCERIDRIMQ